MYIYYIYFNSSLHDYFVQNRTPARTLNLLLLPRRENHHINFASLSTVWHPLGRLPSLLYPTSPSKWFIDVWRWISYLFSRTGMVASWQQAIGNRRNRSRRIGASHCIEYLLRWHSWHWSGKLTRKFQPSFIDIGTTGALSMIIGRGSWRRSGVIVVMTSLQVPGSWRIDFQFSEVRNTKLYWIAT